MLESGASGGARPLPPSESHDEFLEFCATATTGSLSAEERKRLSAHLSQCESCREIMAQYEAILGRVIPAWAPDPAEGEQDSSGWSQDEAEARLFARLGEPQDVSINHAFKAVPVQRGSLAPPKYSGETLWRHLWGQFAAALLLVAALGLIAYRIGIRRGSDFALRAAPTVSRPVTTAASSSEALDGKQPSPSAMKGADPQVEALRSQLGERLAEIERLKAGQVKTENVLSVEKADRIELAEGQSGLSQQLKIAQDNLQAAQQKLDSALSQSAQSSASNAALQQRVDELTESMRERDQEIAREKELLDHDRDIRELMGSRDLYIAEVYDVAKTGDTQKPFGRVFYTKGKSLIFYAYDLDQQPGIERANTFQAWGRVGPDRDRAINLGILYQDNANKKRWVLKSDNPKTLAQIDAVFVTVEPNGGSPHPSGKPLLFAYLRIQPNHP